MADLTDTVAALQAENAMLRRIYDDERSHVATLRETIRELQHEVTRLHAERLEWKPIGERNSRRVSPAVALSVVAAAGAAFGWGLTRTGRWSLVVGRSSVLGRS